MSRVIGYLRRLPTTPSGAEERARLALAGATSVVEEHASADPRSRTELHSLLNEIDAGDTVVVTEAAHLSHSVGHFVSTVTTLTNRGIGFRSLDEPNLSTTTDAVPPALVVAAIDDLRRRLVALRTREGMSTAAAAGRRPGRPTVMTQERVAIALELRRQDRSISHIARVLEVSTAAVRRALTLAP